MFKPSEVSGGSDWGSLVSLNIARSYLRQLTSLLVATQNGNTKQEPALG